LVSLLVSLLVNCISCSFVGVSLGV